VGRIKEATWVTNDLMNSVNAIIGIDLQGRILFWNETAEDTFGYNNNEATNSFLNIILPDNVTFNLDKLVTELNKGTSLTNIMAFFKTKKGNSVQVLYSIMPVFENNSIIGCTIKIRKVSDSVGILIEDNNINNKNETSADSKKKRTFDQIRNEIIKCLSKNQMTTNQISTYTNINWKTVEKHLTFLIGKGLVREVFKSEYVRIFDLTPDGRKHAKLLLTNNGGDQL